MSSTPLIEQLPSIVNNDLVRSGISYEFDDTKDVYEIKKGPATRVFEVSTSSRSFTEGVDYELVEDTNGDYRAIDWSLGGLEPADGELFIIDQEYRSVLARYLEAHDEEFANLEADIVQIISAKQIDEAQGEEIDRVGAIFGQLGRRQGRNDTDYKAYLKSIVESFSGRGSRSGLRFAIAAAVGTTVDNIEIQENKRELSYTVIVSNVDTDFISTSINELADLADPSAVELEEAVIVTTGSEIIIEGGGTVIEAETTGLGGGTLTLDGNSTLG